DLQDVSDAIRRIQAQGIKFHASVVFGFDTDDATIFQETVDFLMKSRVFSVTFNILTPYPGTRVFEQFKAEGRLFSEDWQYYDHTTVVYKPSRMTPMELAQGHLKARRGFYKWSSILRRGTKHMRNPVLYTVLNLAFRFAAKRARVPIAPGGESCGRFEPPDGVPAPEEIEAT
ncbi:MAG: hypothetical protein ACYS47_19280, partial [Planctomycetota bacterium]